MKILTGLLLQQLTFPTLWHLKPMHVKTGQAGVRGYLGT
jgi:hypothetical protein